MTPYREKDVTDPAVAKWASFMPALLTACVRTEGPVLEVGIGHYSTPVLHEFAKAECRKLVSLEDNADWARPFAAKYASDGHTFINGPYDVYLPALAREKWGVVFMDHSPGERRATDLLLFRDCADYLVIHDYTGEPKKALDEVLAGMTVDVFVSTMREPHTLIIALHPDLNISGFRYL